MYSTKTAYTTSFRDLLDKLDDYTIFSYYIGQFKIGGLMNSPLRSSDKMPSFAVFKSRNGSLLFKDHGTGTCGNSLKFIKLYKGIDSQLELERELLRILRKVDPNDKITKVNRTYSSGNTDTVIGIVRQQFTEVDKHYWKRFHISIDTLKKFNVFSIKYFLCNNIVRGIYKDDAPMYAYKVYDKFKIYRPLSSKFVKWRTNLTNRHIQGLEMLPKEGGNILIITKSLKDVMCLYEMGYNAISPSSETTFIPDDILKSLRSKWNNIVILFDRDKTGIQKTREYSKRYKIKPLLINKRYKAKDISDAIEVNGFYEIKTWLTKELKSQWKV